MYAVIDTETTGLKPSWHDRVVEIAVVLVDDAGRIESEWCSLLNPHRDLGPQHIHGITAAEARVAPDFDHVAGTVAELLRGRVVTGHNVMFDLMFLRAEYARIGAPAAGTGDGLCTMRLAARFLPYSGRSLGDCCRGAGIPLEHAHSALDDARASARLLAHFLAMAGQPPPWPLPRDDGWPTLPAAMGAPVGRRAAGAAEPHFLGRLVDRMPRTYRPDADAYLEVLDRALLDRHVSTTEADALVAMADRLDLGRDEVIALHRDYLLDLAVAALSDGVLTEGERHDLDAVAALLGLGPSDIPPALGAARSAVASGRAGRVPRPRTPLRAGDTVVFTGQTAEPREVWEQRARASGLRVDADVTKRTRMLVAADPDSQSGKARKAAGYGIPVVHPAAFAAILADVS